MTDEKNTPENGSGELDDDSEASMRRALERIGAKKPREGRAPAPSFSNAPMSGRNTIDGQKRRFVRDGEVPVMLVTGSRPPEGQSQRRGAGPVSDQVEAVNMALRSERAAHEAADRALREATATIQDLRTKLGHIALARDEAAESARRAETARALLANELDIVNSRLAVEVSARARAERLVAQLAPPKPAIAEPSASPEAAMAAAVQAAPRRRGRPPKSAAVADNTLAAPETTNPPAAEDAPPAAPRRRGRPPKDKSLLPPDQPKRKPGRPRIEREPEPVKWWLPKGARSKPD